jgi:arylsulfatase A-like enzyme
MGRLRIAFCVVVALACACGGEARPRNAVLIVIDTLRPDHLSAYGSERPTSPSLDALAARGALFEQAISNSSWTLPALIGLLSGSHPSARNFERGLRSSEVERLRDAGFQTAAFTEGGYVSRYFGLDRGFDAWEETEGDLHWTGAERPANRGGGIEHTFDRAREWLRAHGDRPFFLLVHTYEVHAPYRRRTFAEGSDPGALGATFEIQDAVRVRTGKLSIGPVERAYLERLYDGGVREADREVGALLDELEALGLTARTLVVVTSDHGEEFGEHYPDHAGDHGHSLYDNLIRVPLIVFDPTARHSDAGRRVTAQVRTLDVMPTVLDRLGVASPPVDGRSLEPLLRGEADAERPAFARLFPRGRNGIGPSRTALRAGGFKVIVNLPFADPPVAAVELYDLSADPAEHTNLAGEDATEREALLARLSELAGPLAEAGLPDLREVKGSEALQARLRALGYAQ